MSAVKERRVWTCSACSRADVWGKGWQWYGSWRDLDDLRRDELEARVVCSDECAERRLVDLRVHPADLKKAKAPKVYRGAGCPDA